mgnify:CR=1 FL=1
MHRPFLGMLTPVLHERREANMLTCLSVLGKASAALANGESEKGQEILSSIINCSKKQTCHSRRMCATATMGLIKGAIGQSNQA